MVSFDRLMKWSNTSLRFWLFDSSWFVNNYCFGIDVAGTLTNRVNIFSNKE